MCTRMLAWLTAVCACSLGSLLHERARLTAAYACVAHPRACLLNSLLHMAVPMRVSAQTHGSERAERTRSKSKGSSLLHSLHSIELGSVCTCMFKWRVCPPVTNFLLWQTYLRRRKLFQGLQAKLFGTPTHLLLHTLFKLMLQVVQAIHHFLQISLRTPNSTSHSVKMCALSSVVPPFIQ